MPQSVFHVMTKPIGPICNMNCTYCFYLEKDQLYPDIPKWAMPEDVLDSYVRQYIEAQDVPEVAFAWQGGEPTLLGVDFFRKAVAFQQQYANGKHITNAFQTNGLLLDDEWCAFFAEHEFLVGLSMDGPENIHNRYRVDKAGKPTFARIMQGMECLKKHGVEFNTLTCVQRHNAYRPLEVYRFFKEVGSGFMQFIPIVERRIEQPRPDGLTLVQPADGPEAAVTEWSVPPLQYGKFLSAIFDEWVRNDVGQIFVQIFDISLQAWLGMPPGLCVFSEVCGNGMALEHNGDLYSCDHFVYPENHLGNLMEQPLAELAHSDQQRRFGEDKRDGLPRYCRECPVHFICHGECPKHRFLKTPDGEPGLNYLCEGYRYFFQHIDPFMRFMAKELQAERPPANVMAYARQLDEGGAGRERPRPNDPCPCGSGRKFKKCCGRKQ